MSIDSAFPSLYGDKNCLAPDFDFLLSSETQKAVLNSSQNFIKPYEQSGYTPPLFEELTPEPAIQEPSAPEPVGAAFLQNHVALESNFSVNGRLTFSQDESNSTQAPFPNADGFQIKFGAGFVGTGFLLEDNNPARGVVLHIGSANRDISTLRDLAQQGIEHNKMLPPYSLLAENNYMVSAAPGFNIITKNNQNETSSPVRITDLELEVNTSQEPVYLMADNDLAVRSSHSGESRPVLTVFRPGERTLPPHPAYFVGR